MRNPGACVSDPHSFTTPSGSRVHEIRELRFDGFNSHTVVVGTEDIQDAIDAEAPYTDLNYMLTRLANGDRSVLANRPPIFGDFTGMPDNPIEAINAVKKAEKSFATLDAEERKKYNNDWKRWFTDVITNPPKPLEPDKDKTPPPDKPLIPPIHVPDILKPKPNDPKPPEVDNA